MVSAFNDLSSFDHDDIISVSDGLESMSDDDDGTSLEERMEGFCDLLFTERVEGARRFIEENDLRILQKYLRDGKSLLLSSAQANTSFSDLRIESVFHLKDEVTVGEMKGFDEFFFQFFFIFPFVIP